jgi:hypothetical protein
VKELFSTIQELRRLDEDYKIIMQFLERPDKHFDLINMVLREQITKYFDTQKSFNDLTNKYDAVLNMIHDNWWGNVYPVHDVHFHKSFESFCNCPFTCITEVTDCLEKIANGRKQ